MTDLDKQLDEAARNFRDAIDESRKGHPELATEIAANGCLRLVSILRSTPSRAEQEGGKGEGPSDEELDAIDADHADEAEARRAIYDAGFLAGQRSTMAEKAAVDAAKILAARLRSDAPGKVETTEFLAAVDALGEGEG